MAEEKLREMLLRLGLPVLILILVGLSTWVIVADRARAQGAKSGPYRVETDNVLGSRGR